MLRVAIITAMLWTVAAEPLLAADKYVRSGGNNGNSGNDWANAYATLATCETNTPRGDTCWVGNGSVGGATFNTAENGTTIITIQKATVAEHGTATGWNDAYAAQAVLGSLTFDTDYWEVTGVYRDEDDWLDGTAYGFELGNNGVVRTTTDATTNCSHHITIRYMDIGGAFSTTVGGTEDPAVYAGCFTSGNSTNFLTVTHSHLHNSLRFAIVQCAGCSDGLFEYNAFSYSWTKESIRGQIVFQRNVIRYNLFFNACGDAQIEVGEACTGDIAAWGEPNPVWSGNEIYGNIFAATNGELRTGSPVHIGGNGTSWLGDPASNTLVFNNTFVGIDDVTSNLMINVLGGSGNICRNNLGFDVDGSMASCNTTSNNTEVGVDPFVSIASRDFHLTNATAAGTSTGQPAANAVDMDGVTRGADGTADIGALEFNSGATPPTVTITTPTSSATYSTDTSPLATLAGTASDDGTVTGCTWANSAGGSGSATGTTSWSISNITLTEGENIITVTCEDDETETGEDVITVTYTPAATPAVGRSRLRIRVGGNN